MRRLIFAVAVVVAAVWAAPAAADSGKTYTVTGIPEVVGKRSFVNFEATITNTAKDSNQKIGSINFRIPDGFTDLVIDVRNDKAGTWRLSGNTVEIRDLQLTGGDSVAVIVEEATAPAAEGKVLWQVVAKSSQTFSDTTSWTLANGEDLDTTVTETEVAANCAGEKKCQVQQRHEVDCLYVDGLTGKKGTCTDANNSLFYVETLITAEAPEDSGTMSTESVDADQQLTLKYVTHTDARCDQFAPYTEPSDLAARFDGPAGWPKTVLYTVSPDLWVATANTVIESCFSAPFVFAMQLDDGLFFEDGEPWFNGLLLSCASEVDGDQPSACWSERTTTVTPQIVVEVPGDTYPGVDPMKY